MSDSKPVAATAVSVGFDWRSMAQKAVKYIIEGVMVALAAYFIPMHKMKLSDIFSIALIATATFSLLDTFLPTYGQNARIGAGFGIGANLVGFPL